ncbi:carboxypeptidase-like regulatory domain-containing protein [Muricauda sp. SCSIO 64092]|uniref:TonB-dependent receptor n=1 Tax=Allomuricauda sp. SCSIO 64092 TaxID=2908842 RepID=UPI001FF46EE6|nr:carboxypeptidase-like regulatory domain-containing protein [Muricauda sp. SCSIO 64092]UOY06533.1 carboxypeptidase-like regulatory domain-containing protein [Muricauda sp. SCSIO 64092]
MFTNGNKLLSLFFSLFSLLTVSAQQTVQVAYRDTPLKLVLQDLEQKTGLLFSFSDELVADKSITKKAKSIKVDDLLTFLGKTTLLSFERIGENQVIVSVPNNRISVCGYLFDRITKKALPYATIIIKGTTKGFTSNENGYFAIENENLTKGVLLQYIGYTSELLFPSDFNKNSCTNFFLNPRAESLREVVVKSYLIQGIDKNTDGSLALNPSQQGLLPGLVESDIFQSSQWVPGITSINETVSDIQIRGGSADQNLILYDGIKMYNTGHFFGMISIFNPNITTGATIFKGGASAEYGDRISGVIDIQGETQVPQKTTAGLGVNGTQADAFVKTRLSESVGLVLSGRRSYSDIEGLGTPTFDAISEKVFQNTIVVSDATGQVIDSEEDGETLVDGEEIFSFYDANLKLIVKPSENDSIYVSGLLTNNDLDFRLLDDENQSQDALTTENQGLSFNWRGVKAHKWHHGISGYYSYYDSRYRNQFFDGQDLTEENLRRNSVTDYGLDVNFAYDFNKGNTLKLGYQISRNEVFYQLFRDELGMEDIAPDDNDEEGVESADERDFNEVSDRKNNSNSWYATYYCRTKNKGFISLGLRATTFSIVNGWYVEPRANIEYPIGKSIRLKLTGEKRFQTVSQLVEFDDTRLRLQSGIWTLTDNDEFPLLESEQFSAGILLDSKGWTIDLDGYLKRIAGLTSFTNGFTSASEEYSQGTSDVLGVDLLIKKQWANYRIWLGYTYNSVDYRFDELANGAFPGNNDITHNVTLSNTYEKGNWRFSMGWNFRTGAPFTPVSGFNSVEGDIEFGAINSQRLPNYHRLDVSAQYQFKWSSRKSHRGTLGVALQNIYSRQVPLSVFYRVDENPETGLQEIDQLEQLTLGFTPNFLMRFYF